MDTTHSQTTPSLTSRLVFPTLCQTCHDFFGNPGIPISHEEVKVCHRISVKEVRESSKRGCAFCAHVNYYLPLSAGTDSEVSFSVHSDPTWGICGNFEQGHVISDYLCPAECMSANRPIPRVIH